MDAGLEVLEDIKVVLPVRAMITLATRCSDALEVVGAQVA